MNIYQYLCVCVYPIINLSIPYHLRKVEEEKKVDWKCREFLKYTQLAISQTHNIINDLCQTKSFKGAAVSDHI